MTSATARRIEAIAAGALARSGWPGSALTATSRATTGKADSRTRRRLRPASRPRSEHRGQADRRAGRESRGRRRRRNAECRVRRVDARPQGRGRGRSRRARRASMPVVARFSLLSAIVPQASCIRSWPGAANSQDSAWLGRRIFSGTFDREFRFMPGVSDLVSFLSQIANICTPSAVVSGGVRWPTPCCRGCRAIAAPGRPNTSRPDRVPRRRSARGQTECRRCSSESARAGRRRRVCGPRKRPRANLAAQ